ncbi:transcription elongation factor GreA [Thermodesulfobacteriota bacterium]
MSRTVPMTRVGYEALKKELDRLKREDRPHVVRQIEEARGHGDLSENAEYDAAKERQGFIETKITEIEDKLARAEVINPTDHRSDRVVFGATVVLEDLDSGETSRYQIVGEDEADIKDGKINVHSPLARAAIGKEAGEEVILQAPGGPRSYEILEILFE